MPSTGGDGERAGRSLLFTFGPSRLTRARTGGDSAGGQRGDDVQSAGGVALPESEGPEGRREEVAPPFEGTPIGLPASVVCEPARRRVRALVSGRTVADSAKAVLFASGSSPPAFFFPPGDLNGELIAEGPPSASGDLGAVGTFRLVHEAPSSGTGGGAPATATLTAYAALDPPHGLEPLRGRVYLPWHEVDTWLEEDDELIGHPRLPYHRVDALWSSRTVVARIGGRLLAASDRPVVVFETGTPPRYYVPRIDTVMHRLVPSGRVADSPYLGRATSYSARIGDRLETDVAWAYPFPVRECPKIAGRICFDESRVEIEVDKAT